MAPYIEAIDSQQFSYFIVSRQNLPLIFVLKCFFPHTMVSTLSVLKVFILMLHLIILMFFPCYRYDASAISCVLDGSHCVVERRSVHY